MAEALLLIDIQNDFCPGGALGVPDGDAVVPIANRLARQFEHVLLTQDWHPPGHSSFASQHAGKSPFETISLSYGAQTLWPDHCVQGTSGADFHPDLNVTKAEMIIRKGFRPTIDSYSAFFENDHTTPTGLTGYLRERDISELVMVGLAYDFCVQYSALDASRLGFTVTVVQSACRAINLDGSAATATEAMRAAGVRLTETL